MLNEDDLSPGPDYVAHVSHRLHLVLTAPRQTDQAVHIPSNLYKYSNDRLKGYSSSSGLLLQYFCRNIIILQYIYSFSTVFLEYHSQSPLLQQL